jgi:hypothetical protein
MKTVDYILDDYRQMKNKRYRFDNLWQEVAQRVDPTQATFNTTLLNLESLPQQKFDSSAARALPKFASIMKSIICPRTRKWSRFCTTDPELTDYFQEYFDEVTETINKLRYSNRSGFDSAVDMMFRGAGLFGQMPFFVDDRVKDGIYYRTFPMSSVYAKCNAYGEKDVFVRKFELDKRQAIEQFGEDNLDRQILDCKEIDKKFEFIHYVCPNEDIDNRKFDKAGMKYSSYYIDVASRKIVSVGGYHSMPYCMSRLDIFPTEEVYGYGAAMQCLPEQKVLNAMMRITMKGAEVSADPEILVRDDEVVNINQFGVAGSVISGGIDSDGKPTVATMQRNINFNYLEKLRLEFKEAIADSFCINLLNILINDPAAKTATEVMVKKQEQAVLLAPMATRQYQEWAAVMALREFDIHDRAGRLPQMPEDLIYELQKKENRLTIEFESPLDDAQKSEDAIKMNRYLEATTPLMQLFPEIATVNDPIEIAKIYAKSIGIPAKVIRKDADIAQAIQQQRQAADAERLLKAAPALSSSAKNLAAANVEAQTGIKLI